MAYRHRVEGSDGGNTHKGATGVALLKALEGNGR